MDKTKRFSMLAGKMVDVPAKRSSASKEAGDSKAITELLGVVAQSQELLAAAQASITELSGRVAQLEQQLMQAVNKPAQQIPAPVVNVQRGVPPTYEVIVQKRDVEGHAEKMIVRPVTK